MDHPMAVRAKDCNVVGGASGLSLISIGEWIEMMALDVSTSKLAVCGTKIEATDFAGQAVPGLGGFDQA